MQGTPDEIRRRYNLEEEKVSGSNFSLPEFISIDEPNEILGVDGTLEIDGDLYINSKLVKTWVVDSGTTSVTGGDWHWRKYSDGTFDAWGIFSISPTTSTLANYAWYSESIYVDLPFQAKNAVLTGTARDYLYYITNTAYNSNNTVSFRICRNTGSISTSASNFRLVVYGTY